MSKPRNFTASILGDPHNPEPRVEMRVDGVPLLDLVREAERPFAMQEGAPDLAGNYAWPPLTPRLARLLAGGRPGTQRADGVLLNCECGWASCWPLSVRVRTNDRFVVWQDLRQLKRVSRWGYEALEPLRFARADYIEEVSKVREALLQFSQRVEARRLAAPARADGEAAVCAI